MKRIVYLIFLLIGASYSQLPAYDIKHENELLQQLNRAPGDSTKLKILQDLIHITTDTPERNTYYINVLLEEASRQGNDYYRCVAYKSHIVNAFNMYDVDAVYKWNALLEPLARKAGLYSLMFEGKRAAIDILNTKRQYLLAEKEAHKMLKEGIELGSDIGIAYAYQSLGYVKAFSFHYREAADYYEKSYAIFNQLNRSISVNEVCNRLIEIYGMLQDYPKRLLMIKRQEEIVWQQAKENPMHYRDDILMNYLNYLNYYVDADNLPEAEKYLHLAGQYHTDGYLVYEGFYRLARISYFYKKEKMREAIAEIDTLLMVSSNANTRNIWEFQKAEFLKALGEYRQALDLYKKTWPIKDSLKIDLLEKQTNQLKKDYNADALLLRQQKTNHITQISFIALTILIILILIWFMIHTYRVHRILSKAEKEQIKLNRDMESASAAKEKFIANINASIRKPLNVIQNNSLLLASRRQLVMEERRLLSETISETSLQLIKLINSILDLSHLEAGLVQYNLYEVEITSMLRGIIVERPEVSAQIEVGTLIWAKVDNDRLIQVLKSIINHPRPNSSLSVSLTLIRREAVHIVVEGSSLSISDPPQEAIIANGINGMIITHFNGSYHVSSSTGCVSVTLPVTQVQKI